MEKRNLISLREEFMEIMNKFVALGPNLYFRLLCRNDMLVHRHLHSVINLLLILPGLRCSFGTPKFYGSRFYRPHHLLSRQIGSIL